MTLIINDLPPINYSNKSSETKKRLHCVKVAYKCQAAESMCKWRCKYGDATVIYFKIKARLKDYHSFIGYKPYKSIK